MEKKEKKVGIEMLRIISMYMILILHYKLHQNISGLSIVNYKISSFIDILCVCAVNCYVLISGYFLSKSITSSKKLLKVLYPVWFYNLLILIIYLCYTHEKIKINGLLQFLFPVSLGEYWFVLCYTVMYLLIPYLKKIIENTTREELKRLIAILLYVSFLSNMLVNSNIYCNIIDKTRGYGIIWLITLFLCAAYIRKYNLENRFSRGSLIIGFIVSSVLSYLSAIFINRINAYDKICFNSNMLSDYNSINIFMNSIFLFLVFLQTDIKSKVIRKSITSISCLTFGVYIIHCQPLIFREIYVKFLKIQDYVMSKNYLLIMLGKCALLFALCCAIEKVRQLIFKEIQMLIESLKKRMNTKITDKKGTITNEK